MSGLYCKYNKSKDNMCSIKLSSYNPFKKNNNEFLSRLESRIQTYKSDCKILRKVCKKH